ncbi:MAG: S-layer homology domain-containing protein [Clostridia bacterium]|nr:S-layer homology domain-containing protein [Clostridia bacterium]
MKLRKILSLILCISLLTSVLSVGTYAQSDTVNDHSEAVEVLERLSMLPGDFDAEKNIGFAGFVSMAMKLTGMSYNAAEGEKSPFKDVDTYDEHYGAIKLAWQMGILSGYGDGTVGYDEKVTLDRGAKILLSMLGYDVKAQAKGGYPAGYIIVAGELDMLTNLGDASSYLTCGQAAQLIYNCLETDILQQESYPDGNYITVDGENPLTKWLKFSKTEGTVTANSFTSLSVGGELEEGFVAIDGESYVENGTEISSFIGCRVEAWYREDGAKKILMHAKPIDDTKTYVVSSSDIAPETNGNLFYYYEDETNDVKKLKISDDAIWLYNFKTCTSDFGIAHLKPENGTVILTCTEGGNTADVVSIKESVTYVVKEANVHNLVITDTYDMDDLRLGDDDVRYVITKENAPITFEEIMPNNVLTVTKTSDASYIEINVSAKKIKGAIEEMGDDSITVNGRRFGILSQNKGEIKKLKPGESVTLLFDTNLEASGFVRGTMGETVYGYLITAMSKVTGLSEKTAFKIFTTDSGVQTFEVSDKISLNGQRRNSQGAEYTGEKLIEEFKDGDTFVHQLIKYEIDDDGKISKILTAKENRHQYEGTGQYDEDFSHDYSYRKGDTRANYVFFKTGGLLGNEYSLNGSLGITVPSEDVWAGGNMTEIEKSFGVFDPMITWPADKRVTMVDLYDVSEIKRPAIVLEYGVGGSPMCGPEFMLVEEVTQGLDEDGMSATFVKGMYDGEYQKLQLKTDSDNFIADPSLLKLQSGDVIRVAKDAMGRVINLIKVFTLYREKAAGKYALYGDCFDALSGGENSADVTSYKQNDFCNFDASAMYAVHATATYNDTDAVWGTHISVNLGRRDENSRDLPLKLMRIDDKKGRIYLYDEKTETVRLATEDELYKDEKKTVIIRSRYAVAMDTIIINWEDAKTGVYWDGGFDK